MNAQERQKRKFKQNVYNVAVFGLVGAVIWIGFEIFNSYTDPDIDVEVTASELRQIGTELYVDLAQILSGRESLTDEQLETVANLEAVVEVVEEELFEEFIEDEFDWGLVSESTPSAEIDQETGIDSF